MKKTWKTIIAWNLRIIIAFSLCLGFQKILDVNISSLLIFLGIALGVSLGTFSAIKHKDLKGPTIVFIACLLAFYFFKFIATHIELEETLSPWFWIRNARACCILMLVAFASTYLWFKKRNWSLLEVTIITACSAWLLSSHRNYNFDHLEIISNFAWDYGLETIDIYIFLGITWFLSILSLLFLSVNRVIFSESQEDRFVFRKHPIAQLIIGIAVLLLVFTWENHLRKIYSSIDPYAANGVGESSEIGESPLQFNGATSKTRQPVALVRLGSDYMNNPWDNMLYLRESTLSHYNGRELVKGALDLADAANNIPLDTPWERNPDEKLHESRISLEQDIYLLHRHKSAFATDLVMRIVPAKNSRPEKFQKVWKAKSLAPTLSLQQLIGHNIGDARWSTEELEEYLKAPESQNGGDPRYGELAKSILQTSSNHNYDPIAMSLVINAYLSKNSTYTRKPGYSITKNDDPIAPYLFSKKMRGFCVHFAHAGVYLFRLSGIPARIAIGYMTDLGYAKDGHILLQLGDRHAWTEIYVRDIGWVIADIIPQNVEGEETLIPNEKLLDELMNEIDPALEISDKDLKFTKNKEPLLNASPLFTSITKALKFLCILTLMGIFSCKCWMRFSHVFPANADKTLKREYRAIVTELLDLGFKRKRGQSQIAHAEELKDFPSFLELSKLREERIWGKKSREFFLWQSFVKKTKEEIAKSIPLSKRLLGFFSLKSLFYWDKW